MNQDISQPGQKQAEKLADIGARLRQIREERLLSIDQVAAKTLIQPRLLRAIEVGDLSRLPEPIYIQGFIKRYAESLGLNGAEFAHLFPTEPDIRAIQPSWKDSPAAQLRPIHLYAFYIVLIVAAVSGLSYLLSRSTSWGNQTSVDAESSVVSGQSSSDEASPEETEASASETTDEASVTDAAAAVQEEPVKVDVELTAQSWLRIMVDGQKEFEGVLPEGTQRTWTADDQLTIRAGNAGGVLLAHNNGEARLMGEPGAVREITFSVSQDAASLPDSDQAQTSQ
ncbi:MAG: helix-turn-helix domain-containing protein [Elainellaceae cyanobacterium]